MSKPKPKVTKVCAICGRKFETARLQQRTCASKECLREFHLRGLRESYAERHAEIQRRRQERRIAKAIRTTGVSPERMAAIAYAQDCGDCDYLRQHAATWTKAERAYAKRRYTEIHHICSMRGFVSKY